MRISSINIDAVFTVGQTGLPFHGIFRLFVLKSVSNPLQWQRYWYVRMQDNKMLLPKHILGI
jgi:hypothetical protein